MEQKRKDRIIAGGVLLFTFFTFSQNLTWEILKIVPCDMINYYEKFFDIFQLAAILVYILFITIATPDKEKVDAFFVKHPCLKRNICEILQMLNNIIEDVKQMMGNFFNIEIEKKRQESNPSIVFKLIFIILGIVCLLVACFHISQDKIEWMTNILSFIANFVSARIIFSNIRDFTNSEYEKYKSKNLNG